MTLAPPPICSRCGKEWSPIAGRGCSCPPLPLIPPHSDPTDLLPANVTIQLTRLRDGTWRATADGTDWPAGLVLHDDLTRKLADYIAVRLHALETGAFV